MQTAPINSSVPYIKGSSERVAKVLKPFNVALSYKSNNTLRKKLCKLKNQRPRPDKTNTIYQIKCQNCNTKYTGEIKRELKERLKNIRTTSSRKRNSPYCISTTSRHSIQLISKKSKFSV